jgi:hypothetical protein
MEGQNKCYHYVYTVPLYPLPLSFAFFFIITAVIMIIINTTPPPEKH